MNWKKIAKLFPLIGIALFVYLIIKIDIKQVLLEIQHMNLIYVPIIIILTSLFFSVQTLKWFVVAKKQKIQIRFIEALKINLMSNFYGFVTPAKLGSAMRISYLKEKGVDPGKGMSNFVVDKTLDLIALFMLTIFFGLIIYKNIVSPYIYCLFLGIFIFGFFLFYNKKTSLPIMRFIHRKFIPKKFKEKSKKLYESFYQDKPSLLFLSSVLLISLFCWTLNYFVAYVIGLSLGINIGFMPYLIILPIATVIAQIPITINGFGTRELAMINLFKVFGVEKAKVFSMSLTGVFIISIIPAIVALIFIGKRKNEIH